MLSQLDEEIETLTKQIEALHNQRLALQRLRAKVTGEDTGADQITKTRSRNVKDTVLGLLASAGEGGLTVNEVLTAAEKRGIHLERGSVSSLLSRLKREQVLDLKDGSYRVKNPSAEVSPSIFN